MEDDWCSEKEMALQNESCNVVLNVHASPRANCNQLEGYCPLVSYCIITISTENSVSGDTLLGISKSNRVIIILENFNIWSRAFQVSFKLHLFGGYFVHLSGPEIRRPIRTFILRTKAYIGLRK